MLLLETIKVENAKVHNLAYHQQRVNQTQKSLWGIAPSFQLSDVIHTPPKEGLYRCRILYDQTLHSVEYIPYVPKEVHHIQIITSTIDYPHKYAERSSLDALLSQQTGVDAVIIEKGGYLTDTTIANIAFYDGSQWYTPHTPLLQGTLRKKLLDKPFLKTKKIKQEDLKHFTKVALMNAMIGFKILNKVSIIDTKGIHYDY